MKKCSKIILAVVIITALAIVMCSFFGEKFNEDLEGEKRVVVYEYVNVREEPKINKSNIITQLYEGETVYLTGRIYETTEDIWYETYDGWIIGDALRRTN